MKILSGLLLGAVVLCGNIFGQAEQTAEIGVETISLARNDGSGKHGEVVDNFVTTDVPIHCLIELNSTVAVTVKMNLVAVKAVGLKAETKIVIVSYTTKDGQNRVSFSASPDGKLWAIGKYRADILLNGKFAKSLEFEIQKSAQESKIPNKAAPQNSKNSRLTRKN